MLKMHKKKIKHPGKQIRVNENTKGKKKGYLFCTFMFI